MKSNTEPFNREAATLENLYLATEGITFSKTTAEKIVGPAMLRALIAKGEIRAEKRTNKQNGKWRCNAADVLRHCKCMIK